MVKLKSLKRFVTVPLAVVLVLVFFLFCWLILAHYDNQIKSELQRLAQLTSESLNEDMIKSLSGTRDDLKRKPYKELKRLLAEHKITIPQARFIYLLGKKDNGDIFFYVDNEPDYSVSYSPPGQIYDEATNELISSFSRGYPFIEGPVKDKYGEWISALVPIRDSESGSVIAVLGVDVDAVDWRVSVFSSSALPIGLMLVILTGFLITIYMYRRKSVAPRHVMRTLLLPMCFVVVILVSGSDFLLLHLYRLNLNRHLKLINDTISGELAIDLENQGSGLAETLESLSMTPSIQSTSFSTVSGNELRKRWQPLFDKLKDKGMEIMAFYDSRMQCVLRMQSSKIKNNELNIASFLKAEKTKQPVLGLELIDGELTLRALQPIVKNGKIDGYIELGKDIDDILETRHNLSGGMLVVLAEKSRMNRENWEIQMHESRIATHWDLLPDEVVVYTSSHLSKSDSELLFYLAFRASSRFDEDLKYNNKTWRAGINYIYNSSGTKIAEIIALTDTTASLEDFREIVFIGFTLGGALLIGLLAFIIALLRHTDTTISAQQAGLHDSQERLSATLHSIGEGVISVDKEGNVVEMNSMAENLTGWKAGEAFNSSFDDVCCIIDADNPDRKISPVAVALQGQVSECHEPRYSLLSRDGCEYLITYCCSPVYDRDNVVAGAVMVFSDMTVEHNRRRELQDSQARLNILSGQGRVLLWEGDESGLYTYVSDSSEQILGYTPDEIVGRLHYYDLHPEAGRQEFKEEASRVVERKEAFKDSVQQVQTRNGNIIWMSSFGMPILDDDGKLLGYRGISRDVTEEKLMNDKLKETEENYRIVFENSQVGTYKTRASDGKMIDCNDRSANILGYDNRADMLENYDPVNAYVNSSDRDKLVKQLNENGRVDNCELALYKKDGNIVWLEASSTLYHGYIMGAMQDITERVHMKMYNELYIDCMEILNSTREQEAAMDKVLEQIIKVSGCDAAGIRLQNGEDFPYFCQSGFPDDFLWTENFLISQDEDGKTVRNPDGTSSLDCFCGMVLCGRKIPGNPLFTPEGSIWTNNAQDELKWPENGVPGRKPRNVCIHRRYLSLALIPVKFKSDVIGLIQLNSMKKGLFSLTAIQKLEQIASHIGIAMHRQEEEFILRDALSQAQVATVAKNQFMANMSHEMRTPLNGIIGSTEILDGTDLTDEQMQYISIIKNSGNQMLHMVDDILYATKASGGGIKVINDQFSVRRMLHNLLNHLIIEAEVKKVGFKVDVASDIPELLTGDSAHVALILKHLCSNAVKFTKAGKITVACSSIKQENNIIHLKFVVKDTGIGIEAGKLERLFEPFSQADDSDKRQFGGAGLGLTIARHMAGVLGGRLNIESTPGKGTTCTLIVPLQIPGTS